MTKQLSLVFAPFCFYWDANQQPPTPCFPHHNGLCPLNLEPNKQSLHEFQPVGNWVTARRKVTNIQSFVFVVESLNSALPWFVDKAQFVRGTLLPLGRMELKLRNAKQNSSLLNYIVLVDTFGIGCELSREGTIDPFVTEGREWEAKNYFLYSG